MNFDLPYPSSRSPVLGRNMVATSQPLAAQAGVAMLARGGTAADAAVAAAMVMTVVEPTGCLAAAAVLNGIVPVKGRRIGVVISGGNVDLERLGEFLG